MEVFDLRAIGQTLTNSGIVNAMDDTTLELFDGNGNSVSFNDNWRDTQGFDIENSGLAPGGERESAILTTFQAGNAYTAIVRGKNGQSRVALVEAYTLP